MDKRKTLMWLQSGGCGGCTLSLIGAESPDFLASLDIAGVDLLWHPSLSEATGTEAIALIRQILAGEIALDILCLEGSVIAGPGGTGRFHMMSGFDDKPMKDLIAELAGVSGTVMGIGSCAA